MTDDRRTEVELERWLVDEEPPRSADSVAAYVIDELAETSQERGWLPRSTWLRFAALGLAAAAGIAVVSLWLQGPPPETGGPTPSPRPSPTASPGAAPSLPAEVKGVYTFAEATWSVVPGDGSIWVQIGDLGMVSLNPATGGVSTEIEDLPNAARLGDSIWSPAIGRGLVEFDALTGQVRNTFPGINGYYIAVDESSAWVTDGGHTLARVDLATGQPVAGIDVPNEPKEVAIGLGAVWVACDAAGVIGRVDPSTNLVTAEIPAGARPVNLAIGEGAVWVWNHGRQLLRIDPATNQIVATIDGLAEGPSVGLAVGGGFVWVAVPDGVARVDPVTNTIIDTIRVGPGVYVDIEWFDGDLWVSTEGRNQVLRITPSL